jgi:hypothetical protein
MKLGLSLLLWGCLLIIILTSIGVCLGGCEIIEDPPDPNHCIAACENIHTLDCEGWETGDGGTCVEVCQSAIIEGGIDMHAECMADAGSCESLDDCYLRKVFLQ